MIDQGKLMQFVPEDNAYVYFRNDDQDAVMVVMKGNAEIQNIKMDRYAERLKGYKGAKDVTTGATFPQLNQIPFRPTQRWFWN